MTEFHVKSKERNVFIGNCVRIAGFITAGGRVNIIKFAQIVGREFVYYIDTDSLDIDIDRFFLLVNAGAIHDTELGKLGIEREIIESLYISRKNYIHVIVNDKGDLEYLWKGKGVNKKWTQA